MVYNAHLTTHGIDQLTVMIVGYGKDEGSTMHIDKSRP